MMAMLEQVITKTVLYVNIYNGIIFFSLNSAKNFSVQFPELTKSSAVGPNHMRSN